MIKYFVIRNFTVTCSSVGWRGTCSFVRMLKGCMVRERLGTPGWEGSHPAEIFGVRGAKWLQFVVASHNKALGVFKMFLKTFGDGNCPVCLPWSFQTNRSLQRNRCNFNTNMIGSPLFNVCTESFLLKSRFRKIENTVEATGFERHLIRNDASITSKEAIVEWERGWWEVSGDTKVHPNVSFGCIFMSEWEGENG